MPIKKFSINTSPKKYPDKTYKPVQTGADNIYTGAKMVNLIPREPAVIGTRHLKGPKNRPKATDNIPYLFINCLA